MDDKKGQNRSLLDFQELRYNDNDNNNDHALDHRLLASEPGPSSLPHIDGNPPPFASSSLSSSAPPPNFEQSAQDKAISFPELENTNYYVPQGGEVVPPPEFTPYEAEYFVESDGNVVSHDQHLNEDGEALYQFLLAQSRSYPGYFIVIHGQHSETRSRTVSYQDSNGNHGTRQESYTETVVDFDFVINLTRHIVFGPIHWSVPDEQPAYRGQMYMEVDGGLPPENPDLERGDVAPDGKVRRKATAEEKKVAEHWGRIRKARGLPPWVGPGTSLQSWNLAMNPAVDFHQTNVLKSSKTLREWADEYCASNKHLKEFTYRKVVYGWNFSALEDAIKAAIRSTYYRGTISVKFLHTANKIRIRPDNRLSRTLSNFWLKVLLWILLIYPFIWLFKRFHKKGGGKWEVCGGAYAVKYWQPSDDLPAYAPSASTAAAPANAKLVGMKEGEWFQQWEGTIKRAEVFYAPLILIHDYQPERPEQPALTALTFENAQIVLEGGEEAYPHKSVFILIHLTEAISYEVFQRMGSARTRHDQIVTRRHLRNKYKFLTPAAIERIMKVEVNLINLVEEDAADPGHRVNRGRSDGGADPARGFPSGQCQPRRLPRPTPEVVIPVGIRTKNKRKRPAASANTGSSRRAREDNNVGADIGTQRTARTGINTATRNANPRVTSPRPRENTNARTNNDTQRAAQTTINTATRNVNPRVPSPRPLPRPRPLPDPTGSSPMDFPTFLRSLGLGHLVDVFRMRALYEAKDLAAFCRFPDRTRKEVLTKLVDDGDITLLEFGLIHAVFVKQPHCLPLAINFL
ncbi:hypothetical protein K474DRAFT_1698656 [Panus rudis PR-1116 ss-1]|nr:hypothetical protein K474DRAFT_1698656 [Panus rudis PR-1116 ss-1]